jgi:sulfite reductase alpha subunit-like flavoprotein
MDQVKDDDELADVSNGRSLLVLYGSETGNAEDIAGDIGKMAQRLRFTTSVEEMNDISLVGPLSLEGFYNYRSRTQCAVGRQQSLAVKPTVGGSTQPVRRI